MAESQSLQNGVVCGSICTKKNSGEQLYLLPYSIGGCDQGTPVLSSKTGLFDQFGSVLSFEMVGRSEDFLKGYFTQLSGLCSALVDVLAYSERSRKLSILSRLFSGINESIFAASGIYPLLDNRDRWSQVKRTILIEDSNDDLTASETSWQVHIELDTVKENGFPPMPTNVDKRFVLYNPYLKKFTV